MADQQPEQFAIAARRRGIKLFTAKLACFAVLQLICVAAVEWKLAESPNPYNLKKARLESGVDAAVLLVGSSHVLGGLNPDELGIPAINLAGYSQDLYYDTQLVIQSLDRLPSLKCVVLGLSYFTLEYDMEKTTEAWRSCYYRRYFGIPHRHIINEFDIRNFSLFCLYGPAISKQVLLGQSPDLTAMVRPSGWAANPVPADSESAMSDGAARVAAHHGLMDPEILGDNLAILNGLLDLLHERHIQVVLVTTPVCHTYFESFDPQRDSRFRAAIAQLQSRYHDRYFDFTRDERFSLADFYNSDHLNLNGATKLSRMFGHELQAVVNENPPLRLSSQQSPPR